MKLSRKDRLIVFAAFALAFGVVMSHESQIPIACVRAAGNFATSLSK